jgi:hypothetical protein
MRHETRRPCSIPKGVAVISILILGAFGHIVQGSSAIAARPFTVPCRIDTYGETWNGSLAYGLFEYNQSNIQQLVGSHLVVMTISGALEYLRESSGSGYSVVKQVSGGMLMYQGEPGAATHFWNLETNETTDFPSVTGHHDVEYNTATNTFLTLRNYVKEIDGRSVLLDKIVELNDGGGVLWTWDTYDYLSLDEACPFNDTTLSNGQTLIDFTHANTVQWNTRENVVYLNIRNLNTFYKINKTSGELIWGCGEHGNFTLLDDEGKKTSSLWYHSHAVREVEPDVFIMFDNDLHNQTNADDTRSRIIEVTLSEQDVSARVSWSWTAPEAYYSQYWGDAVRLPNGDRLGTFGTPGKDYANDTGAVLVEVSPEGEAVRTYTFPRGWGVYRAENVSIIIDGPAGAEQTGKDDSSNSLDSWLVLAGLLSPVVAAAGICIIYLMKRARQRAARGTTLRP